MKLTAAYCIEQVLLSENRPLYLHEIRQAIVDRFGEWHSESAISARIRDSVRPSLLKQGVSIVSKAPKGKSAHRYWVTSPEIERKAAISALESMNLIFSSQVYYGIDKAS